MEKKGCPLNKLMAPQLHFVEKFRIVCSLDFSNFIVCAREICITSCHAMIYFSENIFSEFYFFSKSFNPFVIFVFYLVTRVFFFKTCRLCQLLRKGHTSIYVTLRNGGKIVRFSFFHSLHYTYGHLFGQRFINC